MYLRIATLLPVIASALLAQTASQSSESVSRPVDAAPSALDNLSIEPVGPGDLVEIYVAGYQEITRSYRVSIGGTVELPVLKKAVNVNRLTAGEIEAAVAKELVNAKLLVDPVVSVSVLEYRSKPVNVAGAVHQPITVQAIGNLRLLDAISKAGGLAPEAGAEIIVSRPEWNGEPAYVRRIPVKELMGNSDSALNLVLQGGEQIRVPVADKLYIAGNVKNPGAYPMDQAGGLTVIQALALCQGTLSFSQRVAVVYRSTPGSSARQEISIPLRDIMKRRTQDVRLLPNDILYIPDASGKRMSAAVLDRIAAFGGTTGSGLIIWGNR